MFLSTSQPVIPSFSLAFSGRHQFQLPETKSGDNFLSRFYQYSMAVPVSDEVVINTSSATELQKNLMDYLNLLYRKLGAINVSQNSSQSLASQIEEQLLVLPNPFLQEKDEKKLNQTLIFDKWPKALEQIQQEMTQGEDGLSSFFRKFSQELEGQDLISTVLQKKCYQWMSNGLPFYINDEALNNITESDETVLFVANHPRISPDDLIRTFGFLGLLYQSYEEKGIINAPKTSYFITSQLVDLIPDSLKSFFKNGLGLVGYDASSYPSEESSLKNKILYEQIDNFSSNKTHLFYFPEGMRRIYDNLPLEQRIQEDLGQMILQAAGQKKRVKVISIGIEPKKGEASLYIGEPRYYTLKDNQLYVNQGNFNSEIPITLSNEHFSVRKSPETAIEKQSNRLLARVISGIQAEDLKTSINKSLFTD